MKKYVKLLIISSVDLDDAYSSEEKFINILIREGIMAKRYSKSHNFGAFLTIDDTYKCEGRFRVLFDRSVNSCEDLTNSMNSMCDILRNMVLRGIQVTLYGKVHNTVNIRAVTDEFCELYGIREIIIGKAFTPSVSFMFGDHHLKDERFDTSLDVVTVIRRHLLRLSNISVEIFV